MKTMHNTKTRLPAWYISFRLSDLHVKSAKQFSRLSSTHFIHIIHIRSYIEVVPSGLIRKKKGNRHKISQLDTEKLESVFRAVNL